MDWSKNEGGQLISRQNMYCLPNVSIRMSIWKCFMLSTRVDLFHDIQNSADIWDTVTQPVLKFTYSVYYHVTCYLLQVGHG